MKTLQRGILLSFEGIDGSGKSLLTKNVAEILAGEFDLMVTKEPGGSPLGKELRKILQEQATPVCAKAEFLLFAADRAQHFETMITPALKSCKIVLSDRLADSSLAYQGFGRNLDVQMLQHINSWAMSMIEPELVFYVKVPIATAVERRNKRNEAATAFEKEHASFFEKISTGYDTIFAKRHNVITLDGTLTPEELATQTVNHIMTWIKNNRLLKNS